MPELPEIALYKKYLDATALHQKITKVGFPDSNLLQDSPDLFKKALKDKELESSERTGKYLFVKIKNGKCMVLHFGMTGKLAYYKDGETPDYTKMLLTFENDFHLAFICPRKFGKIYLAESAEQFREEHQLGKDALEFSEKEFVAYLQKKKGSLKSALMDQKSISGIGNIYADEIAFQCQLHPKSKVPALSEKDRKALYEQMKKVLKTVIEKDAVRSHFPKNYLTPHRKEGADCPVNDGKIEQIKISGRSTYFCPDYQKLKS